MSISIFAVNIQEIVHMPYVNLGTINMKTVCLMLVYFSETTKLA